MTHTEEALAELERLQEAIKPIADRAALARKRYYQSRSQARRIAFIEADQAFTAAIEECDRAHETLAIAQRLDAEERQAAERAEREANEPTFL